MVVDVAAASKERADGGAEDAIFIRFGGGVVARMEVFGGFFHG